VSDRSAPAPLDAVVALDGVIPADGAALRALMRRMASPVVVVTAETVEGPRGATIGSFTSVSLDPPLISFNVTRDSRLHRTLLDANGYAVHLLAADQAALAAHFALPNLAGEAQFAPYPHHRVDGLPPLLSGTLGILLCTPYARLSAGDHSVFVGEVERVLPGREDAPLLYLAQAYRGVGEVV